MKRYSLNSSAVPLMAAVLSLFLAPATACAHVAVGQTSGLVQGILHPITGLDHIAAMVAVGLWAAQCGGRVVWTIPLTFMAIMAMGGLVGFAGISIPFVEPGIAASVLVLGLLMAAAVRLPLLMSSLLVGLFAMFHGHAHGTEMPLTVTGLAYGVGFVLSTGLLHGWGIAMGLLFQHAARPYIIRYAGGATAALGLYLFIV